MMKEVRVAIVLTVKDNMGKGKRKFAVGVIVENMAGELWKGEVERGWKNVWQRVENYVNFLESCLPILLDRLIILSMGVKERRMPRSCRGPFEDLEISSLSVLMWERVHPSASKWRRVVSQSDWRLALVFPRCDLTRKTYPVWSSSDNKKVLPFRRVTRSQGLMEGGQEEGAPLVTVEFLFAKQVM